MKAKREKSLKEEALVNEIATEWTKVKQEDRTANHTLESLITEKKKEHGLEDVTITKDCIRKRVTRKRLICARNPGSQSPMKPVEEYLVSIFNQIAKMRQPLCISEGLALANSLVTGTKWERPPRREFHHCRFHIELWDRGSQQGHSRHPSKHRPQKCEISDSSEPTARSASTGDSKSMQKAIGRSSLQVRTGDAGY